MSGRVLCSQWRRRVSVVKENNMMGKDLSFSYKQSQIHNTWWCLPWPVCWQRLNQKHGLIMIYPGIVEYEASGPGDSPAISALFTQNTACRRRLPQFYASGPSMSMYFFNVPLVFSVDAGDTGTNRGTAPVALSPYQLASTSVCVPFYLGTWLNLTFICSSRVSLHRSVG
jgi:hypothetical protein